MTDTGPLGRRTMPGRPNPYVDPRDFVLDPLPEPEPEVIPEPEVRARPIQKGDKLGGASLIINFARKQGWTVRATYARGPLLDADGGVNRIVDSIMVKAWRPENPRDDYMVATWISHPEPKPREVAKEDWTADPDKETMGFEMAYVMPGARKVNATEARARLTWCHWKPHTDI